MNPVLRSVQMRELDRRTIEDFGIESRILMANAGRIVADHVNLNYPGKRCAIVCGGGNNGGDGYACALYLASNGMIADIFETKDHSHTPDAAYFRNAALRHCHCLSSTELDSFDTYDIIIDSLTGTGFSGPLREDMTTLISLINESSAAVVSIDLPSGLPADNVSGLCVRADVTITIGCHKPVTVSYPGKDYCGNVVIADIGFPKTVLQSLEPDLSTFSYSDALPYLCLDAAIDTHKYKNGAVLVIAGSNGMEGAALMTVSSLLETGCGICVLVTPESSASVIRGKIPELIVCGIDEKRSEDEIVQKLQSYIVKGFHTVLAGPGMGRGDFAGTCLSALCKVSKSSSINVILDGDALFFLPTLDHAFSSLLITPHFGEAATLLGVKSSAVFSDRINSAIILSRQYSCVVHLKGPHPVSSDADRTLISISAETKLACAGSGDVLSGIIASFIARNGFSDKLMSVAFCAELHSLAAGMVSAQTIRATDIIGKIRNALSCMLTSK